jgi:hypothetical protein
MTGCGSREVEDLQMLEIRQVLKFYWAIGHWNILLKRMEAYVQKCTIEMSKPPF